MINYLDLFTYSENSPLLFTQTNFWIFFGVIMVLYLYLHKTIEARNMVLMIFSLYFYYLSSGFYFIILIISTIIDYYIGGAIYKAQDHRKRKGLLILSLSINLFVLSYFKYSYFFADGLNTLLGLNLQPVNIFATTFNALWNTQLDTSSIFLPVGISFYTFQTISYSVDIYRGHLSPVKTLTDFALFVSFFPQLVAGPIVRASDFIPQIYQPYRLNEEQFGRALYLILCGLIKKILISDYLSINFIDRVYDAPLSYSGFENLIASYAYAIQIYCDFSGYTDIAIGVSLLLGFGLPINFNSPYKALNITDFWRRWHISLSSFLRDYLYIPMGGNRHGKFRTYFHLFATMFLGGLWHGAHIRFVIWGMLHGVALGAHKAWMDWRKKSSYNSAEDSLIVKILAGFITFNFVTLCWILFRAEDMTKALQVMTQIVTNFNFSVIPQVVSSYYKIFVVLMLGFTFHLAPNDMKSSLLNRLRIAPDLAKIAAIVFVVILLFQSKSSDVQPFIYFQF